MTWTRHRTPALNRTIKPGELVPVTDRIQWMLGFRLALAVVVLGVWLLDDAPRGAATTWVGWFLMWPAGTALTLLTPRVGRRVARAALTVSLLGDGVLLGAAGWALGQLFGVIGFLIILHAVAVTLLASFRTGVRIAVWHSLVTMLYFDAVALGMLARTGEDSWASLGSWLFFGALWTAVLSTAGFAAVNERELRRRRHDSEMLRQFGLAASTSPDAAAITAALAECAHAELPANRTAVLAFVRGPSEDDGHGIGALVDQHGTTHFPRLVNEVEPDGQSAVRRALTSGPLLLSRLDQRTDSWLVDRMPGARNVVVLPFATDKVIGALVVESRVRRLERRLLETAMQAVLHASVALDRIVLTDQARIASETDGLTRVANRRRFDEALLNEMHLADVNGTELSLALVDIDFFKKLNDTYGHQTGDEVLQLVAAAIKESVGERHLVARYGGEEFAVIMPATDGPAALATAERIRLHLGAAPTVAPVTASLGVATCPAHGTDPATLIASADAALYRSKHNGRNRTTMSEGPSMSEVLR